MNIDEILSQLDADEIIENLSSGSDILRVYEIIEKIGDSTKPYSKEDFKSDLNFFLTHPQIKKRKAALLKYAFNHRQLKK